jgi:cytidylate kinase
VSRACFVIAIDGPSGAGKSTASKRVAAALGLRYLDSGALYRAVGLAALEAGVDLDDEQALSSLLSRTSIRMKEEGRVIELNGSDVTARLREPAITDAASRTSALPVVRRHLIELQRQCVAFPGAVVEGRDMGTVVFPHADVKVFLDADLSERAHRRATEMADTGRDAPMARIRREMKERDQRDSTRSNAPLRAADGAFVLDSTHMSLDEVVSAILQEADRIRARK